MAPEKFIENEKKYKSANDIIVDHFGGHEDLKRVIGDKIREISNIERNKIYVGTIQFTEFVFNDYPDKELFKKRLRVLNHIVNGIAKEEYGKEVGDLEKKNKEGKDGPKLSRYEYFLNYGKYPEDEEDGEI